MIPYLVRAWETVFDSRQQQGGIVKRTLEQGGLLEEGEGLRSIVFATTGRFRQGYPFWNNTNPY